MLGSRTTPSDEHHGGRQEIRKPKFPGWWKRSSIRLTSPFEPALEFQPSTCSAAAGPGPGWIDAVGIHLTFGQIRASSLKAVDAGSLGGRSVGSRPRATLSKLSLGDQKGRQLITLGHGEAIGGAITHAVCRRKHAKPTKID